MKSMHRTGGAMVLLMAAALATGPAAAASIVNTDAEPRTVVVTEGGSRMEMLLNPGEAAEICPNGCFITMPDGDRAALTGSETIEIAGGKGRIR